MFKKLILLSFFFFSVAYGKIYDCFLFFNEWEILEIRLNELYDHVDKFIILEASESFRGLPKPYYFEMQKQRYAPFLDKIITIKLDSPLETDNAWVREEFQRNQLIQGLIGCSPNDIVLISDVDEFIPGSVADELPKLLKNNPIFGFRQRMFRFFLNREVPQVAGWWWSGMAVTSYDTLLKTSAQYIRTQVRTSSVPCFVAGWHFTSMGGFDRCYEKWENYSHWDGPHPFTYEQWREEVDSYPLVPIDSSYPKFVQENVNYLISIGLIDG